LREREDTLLSASWMRFDTWWCDSNADANVLHTATHNPHQLPPCFDSACALWAERHRLKQQIAAAAAAGQQEGDTAQLHRQLRACTPHGHMGRYLSSGKQAWLALPEVRWPHPDACTVGDVAAHIRATLRQAWWPGIPEGELQQPVHLGGAIDYLHAACERPALTMEQQQRVLQACGGGAADAGQQAAALRTELINTALGTKCMLINQTGTAGQLPPGCSVHHHRRTHGVQRNSLRARPPPTEPVYMRVQLSSTVRDSAHRWLAWLRLGPPPQEDWCHDAVHLCNNKNCLNPYHILWVSDSTAQRGLTGARRACPRGPRIAGHVPLHGRLAWMSHGMAWTARQYMETDCTAYPDAP
jgi:hypothetical protein